MPNVEVESRNRVVLLLSSKDTQKRLVRHQQPDALSVCDTKRALYCQGLTDGQA